MVLLFQSEPVPHYKAFLFLEVIICHSVLLSRIISKWNYSLCTIVVKSTFFTQNYLLWVNYVFMYLLNFCDCWSYMYPIIIFCCANFNGLLKYIHMLIMMITYMKKTTLHIYYEYYKKLNKILY